MLKETGEVIINWNDEITRILTSEGEAKQSQLSETQQGIEKCRQFLDRLQVPLMLEEVNKQCWKFGIVTFGAGPFKTFEGDVDAFLSLKAEWLEYIPAHKTTVSIGGLYEMRDETVSVPDEIVISSKTLLVGARELRDICDWRKGLHQATINDGRLLRSVFTIMDGRRIPNGVEGWEKNMERRVKDETECTQILKEMIARILLEERKTKSSPIHLKEREFPFVLQAVKKGVILPKGFENYVN